MIAKNNNSPKTRPHKMSTIWSPDKLWDYFRISYLWFFFFWSLNGIYMAWTQSTVVAEVIPWHSFVIQIIFIYFAIIFATQLQIEKRKLNTSFVNYLGFRWQKVDIKKIVLCTLVYLILHYTSVLKELAQYQQDQLQKASIKVITEDIPLWKQWIASVKTMFTTPKLEKTVTLPLASASLPKPWWAIWCIGLSICVLSPITEEMLFRGVIINELKYQRIYPKLALILSSVLFMISHGFFSFEANLLLVLFGMLYGWLRYRSGTLYLPIWLHILKNTTNFLSILYLLYHGVDLPNGHFIKTIKYYTNL